MTREERLIETLATTPDPRRRRALLKKTRPSADVAFLERLTDVVPVRGRVDLRQAERLVDAAGWIALRIGDEYASGRSLRARGHVLALAGRSEAAYEAYREAIACFTKAGKPLEAAITRSGALQVMIYLGRYAQAFTWARQARRTFEQAGDRLRLGRLDSNFANVLYRQDRFTEALALYRRAYKTLTRVGAPNDVAIALRNTAVCLISLNQFDQALATHHRARAHAERHNLPLLVAEADYNIAYLYYLRGEYSRAIELYAATRRRCERLGDLYHRALCDLDESELSLELNLTADGARLGQQAYERFSELDMNYEAAKALTWLAIAASQAGDSAGALRYFGLARRRFRAERNRTWLAVLDLYQAIVLIDDDRRLTHARELAEAAQLVFVDVGLPAKAALAELVIARAALRAGDPATAEQWCNDAIERLATTQAPVLRFQASFVRGQIEEARGRTVTAADAYLEAHAWLETLRTDLRAEETKIVFLCDKLVVYESVVAIALAGGPRVSRTGAFTFIEQAKSRSLADLIAFRAHRFTPRTAGTGAPVRRLHQLREALNWCYREIDARELSGGQPGRVETLRARARTLENQITHTLTGIRATDSEWASLQNSGTIELPAVQMALEPDEVIVEYYAARGMLCACVIGRRSFEVVPLGRADEARHHAQLLQLQLSKFRLGASYRREFAAAIEGATTTHLGALYRELMAPLRGRIAGRALTIVPHGFLHYVPFHALHDGTGYLIDSAPVSYAPSASVLYLCRTKTSPHTRAALVLGVSDQAAPHIDEEVDAVAATLPRATVFKGRRASVARLKTEGPKSRVIHIATHAAFRLDNPMFSAISLGDGPLSLFDLYDLRVSAELVTLSGCGTGLNALMGGDELLGLVRGWLYAGAQSVVVSLWDVNDRSTAALMADFYQRLRDTADKAAALRGAMLAARDRDPHPYYWAPFVLIGARMGRSHGFS